MVFKMKNVLVAAPISSAFVYFLEQEGYRIIALSGAEVEYTCEGIITSNKLKLDRATLQKYPNVQWIARLGSGMEIIDTAYCKEKGIRYYSSPRGIANSVAEHAMGMVLNILHRIHSSYREIKNGEWIREPNRGTELSSKTVGIIGYGYTGKAFAAKLKAFTSSIWVYDKYLPDIHDPYVRSVQLDELQQHADIISFHVPLNSETHHYYNDTFLANTKPHILLNTSRGAVCSTETILHGLAQGSITAACLDVLEEEPYFPDLLKTPDNPVQQLTQYPVLLTPHIAGYSFEAIERMSEELMEQLKRPQ
jgi:D-3-phosphoglycerate dehydrogenase